MILATKTKAAIERNVEIKQGDGFREHLGASLIGNDCVRQIWYTWRWARKSRFSGQLLRLFDRGNREEERIVKWLRDSGTVVQELNSETNEQFRIEDFEGHFGGSLDSRLFDTPDLPGLWILGEFKTHNDKQFKELKKQGVFKSHKKHYVQMQIYMHYGELPFAMYFGINKNTDELHIEIIAYDRTFALSYIERAAFILGTPVPPNRISDSPGWYQCQWCDFIKVCHFNAPKEHNCRTCIHSKPIDRGRWICSKFNYVLTKADQKRGCTEHEPIPES
jgi:hypothetical protein